MSRQANERRMRALVMRWREEGGISAAAFAAKHGVSVAKFGYWRRRLAAVAGAATPKRRERSAPQVEFRPVQVLPAAAFGGATVEIALAGGERVLVHHGASGEMVSAVLSALRTRC